ncbi:acyltransferase family protein [Aureimonas ureilytica]|uniref:acyltransferase family protein n=1 Tax=Aureimonas ureilytica TaxID=401562 RepID=UPI0007346690|nr:acyltransferase family protein [Aureimonas ureilytica]
MLDQIARRAGASQAQVNARPSYRADIDGLRAIAVLAVVFFHLGLLPGGFVGVDIFFVISGFLISRIIFSEVDAGTFSIARFYERRIRRIVPALTVVMLATVIGFAFVLTPVDFKSLGQSMAATVAFLSNIYFLTKTGYFDPSSELAPLLHTWSLAVEEQYYLLFPLVAMAIGGAGASRRRAVVLIGFVLSLALSIWLVRVDATLAFYLPFTRFWEILAGALVALAPRAPPSRARAEASSLLGLALLAGSLALYHEGMLFPGESALPPVIGAALILYGGRGERHRVSALLSLRPLVFVGLISYSLYLWHWPIIVALRYVLMREPEGIETGLALVAMFACAVLSWRFVERPLRHERPETRGRLFLGTAALGALVVLFAGLGQVTAGFPGRLPERARADAAAALDTNPRRAACDRLAPDRLQAGEACVIGDPNAAEADFLFMGDSFADASLPGMSEAARRMGRKGYALVHSGCFALAGVDQPDPDCRPFVDAALAFAKRHSELKQAVLTARWTSALLGNRFGQSKGENWLITDEASPAPSLAENRAVFRRGLARLMDGLAPMQVSLVAFIPEQRYDVPRALMLHDLYGHPAQASLPLALHEARQAPLRAAFADLARTQSFQLVDVGASLCSVAQGCPMQRGGVVLYADDNHLSRSGALALSDVLARALRPGG